MNEQSLKYFKQEMFYSIFDCHRKRSYYLRVIMLDSFKLLNPKKLPITEPALTFIEIKASFV